MSWGILEVAQVSVSCLAGGGGLSGERKVLGGEVVRVQSVGKLVCAGGIWGPALTSTLFLRSAFKGRFGGGLLGRQGRHLGVSGWRAGLCWPPNVFQVSVAFISTICPGTPVEEAVIKVAELRGH